MLFIYRIRQNIRGGKLSRLDNKMVIRGKTFTVKNLAQECLCKVFNSACKLKCFDTCGPSAMAEEFKTDSSDRGYHVYQGNWIPIIGKQLNCEREDENPGDRYAVAIKEVATS